MIGRGKTAPHAAQPRGSGLAKPAGPGYAARERVDMMCPEIRGGRAMRPWRPVGLACLAFLASAPAPAQDEPPPGAGPGPSGRAPRADAENELRMTPAVACRSIEGFEDYEPLPDPALTSGEKLLIYYPPPGRRGSP